MVLLENDTFLSELTKLFQSSRLSGLVTITMKRYDGRTKPHPKKDSQQKTAESSEHMCLVRATCRSKKISTIIHQRDVNKFQLVYSNLLKGNIDGLKKLKKQKGKAKATQ